MPGGEGVVSLHGGSSQRDYDRCISTDTQTFLVPPVTEWEGFSLPVHRVLRTSSCQMAPPRLFPLLLVATNRGEIGSHGEPINLVIADFFVLTSTLSFLGYYSLSAHPKNPSLSPSLVTNALNGIPGALQTFRWRLVTFHQSEGSQVFSSCCRVTHDPDSRTRSN